MNSASEIQRSAIITTAVPGGRAVMAWVCVRSLAGTAGSNPGSMSLVNVVCGQVEFSA